MNAIDDIRIRAGVEYVSEEEAADVIQWLREWIKDTKHVDRAAMLAAPAWLLRTCDRLIEGGVAFVLADVRRARAFETGSPDQVESMLTAEARAAGHRVTIAESSPARVRSDREHDAAREWFEEGLRLADVAREHHARMMASLTREGDPDGLYAETEEEYGKRQRGNAAAFAHCEGVASGLADCLERLGFREYAERVRYALDHGSEGVSREPADH